MKKITEKIVMVKSIADQIIEAPVDTVVIVKYGDHGPDRMAQNFNIYSDALVKTGIEGYKAARYEHEGYLGHKDIHDWVATFPPTADFYFA